MLLFEFSLFLITKFDFSFRPIKFNFSFRPVKFTTSFSWELIWSLEPR